MDNSVSTLDPFAKPKNEHSSSTSKPNSRMGGIGFFDDLEVEEFVANAPIQIAKVGSGIFGDLMDLIKNDVVGGGASEKKTEKRGLNIGGKTEINFSQQEEVAKKEAATVKKDFYQRLEVGRKDLQYRELEQVMEDLARLEVGAMSTDEKNKTLHLSADYDEKNIRDPYHLHALRQKKLEQFKGVLQNQKDSEMAAATPNLSLRLDANEGQSMVSQSGAIMSAG